VNAMNGERWQTLPASSRPAPERLFVELIIARQVVTGRNDSLDAAIADELRALPRAKEMTTRDAHQSP
jgi:hypothetical protein